MATQLEDDEDLSNLDRGNDFEGSEDEDEEIEEVEESEEEETEEEEVEEEIEEEVEEEEVVSKKDSIKVPKSRLDKVIAQREELKERSLWLEEQLEKLINLTSQTKPDKPNVPEEPPFDFDTAEEQYAIFLIEGDTVKAAKLRKEIEVERQKTFKALIADIKQSSEKEVTDKVKEANESEKFKVLISAYESKYTFLDADSDDSNEEAIDTVNALMSGYLAKGSSKSEALKKAVEKVAPMYSKETTKTVKSLGAERKIAAGKKAADASKAQPTKTKSSGSTTIDATKLSVAKMSEHDFNKLTPRELKALRGD